MDICRQQIIICISRLNSVDNDDFAGHISIIYIV